MGRKLIFLLPAALFAVLVIAFAVGLRHDPHLVPSALINRPAPDFALPGLYESANGLTRNDLDGRMTLVNFFASWCAPCREEHTELMALGRVPGVTLDGIAISGSTATARPRSILGFTVCRRLMSWTAPATSVIATSVP
jgi:cytochrome c biogenesis protein CcmG, thiol:disulfide interchange protein DsbE